VCDTERLSSCRYGVDHDLPASGAAPWRSSTSSVKWRRSATRRRTTSARAGCRAASAPLTHSWWETREEQVPWPLTPSTVNRFTDRRHSCVPRSHRLINSPLRSSRFVSFLSLRRRVSVSVCLSVCLYICLCIGHTGKLNQSRCLLGADSCRSKESCIKLGPDLLRGRKRLRGYMPAH